MDWMEFYIQTQNQKHKIKNLCEGLGWYDDWQVLLQVRQIILQNF